MAAGDAITLSTGFTDATPVLYSSNHPADIPVHFIQTFMNSVIDLAQQKFSRLRGLFREEPVTGQYLNFELSAPDELDLVTSRYGPTVFTEPDEQRRQVGLSCFRKAFLVEDFDPNLLMIDPETVYTRKVATAAGRRWDDTILAAAFGAVRTGHDGSTAVNWEAENTDCNIITDYQTSGLTLNSLLEAGLMLDEAEFIDDDEPRYAFCSPRDLARLLTDEKLTSRDYTTVQTLINGEIHTFCGFKFIKTNRLLTTDNDQYFRTLFCTQSAIVCGLGRDLIVRINEESTQNYATSIFASMYIAAMRIQEAGVVEIQTPAASVFPPT